MYNGVYSIDQFAYINDTLTKWIKNKISGVSIGDRLWSMSIRMVAIYGMGEIGKAVYQDIKESKVCVNCFIDKNAGRYPNGYENLDVLGLDQVQQIDDKCYILITPEFFFSDILLDLLERSVPLERIVSLAMVM